jgi:hypothetical protein
MKMNQSRINHRLILSPKRPRELRHDFWGGFFRDMVNFSVKGGKVLRVNRG